MSLIPEWMAEDLRGACNNVGRIAEGLERRNLLLEESNIMAREHQEANRTIVAARKRLEADYDAIARDWLHEHDPGPRDPEARVASLAKFLKGSLDLDKV